MAEVANATMRDQTANALDSASYLNKKAAFLAAGDTTPWQQVFEEFSVFMSGGTTLTATIQMADNIDGTDAFTAGTQSETDRGGNYEFTGYMFMRVVLTAYTGTVPKAQVSYRKD